MNQEQCCHKAITQSIQETAKVIQKKMYTFRSLEVKQCEPEADQTPRRLYRGIVIVMFCPHLWLLTCEKQTPPRDVGLF
jgi:hypothetical protein